MTALKWILVLVVLGYGGLLALMYVFQRALMYFPDLTRTSPAAAGLPQAEEISLISADGETLIAWYVRPRGAKPVVIYFQGNAEGLAARVGRFTWLTADGTGLLALCYRGYCGSTGKPSEIWSAPRCNGRLRFCAYATRHGIIVLSASRSGPPSPRRSPPIARSAR